MAANDWLRLWHDMPNDPKWRTIARVSGQPISVVISTYIHLIVDASRNVTRGHVSVTAEDIASALDVTEEEVNAILSAMQGRVIDGDRLTGWSARQPKKEDQGNPETGARSAAERKRDQRARENHAAQAAAQNEESDMSRDVTRCHAREDIEEEVNTPLTPLPGGEDGTWDVEDKIQPDAEPLPAEPRRRRPAGIPFAEWLKGVKERGEKPISEFAALWEYADAARLPREFVELAWMSFADHYRNDEKAKRKRYADWKMTFLNAVKGNYRRLWYWSERDDAFRLTTAGLQLENTLREAA